MAEKSVLQRIVERRHFKFVDSVDSWEEAVKLCCEPLAEGSVHGRLPDPAGLLPDGQEVV